MATAIGNRVLTHYVRKFNDRKFVFVPRDCSLVLQDGSEVSLAELLRNKVGEKFNQVNAYYKASKRLGVMLAAKIGEKVIIGWSRCKSPDRFDPQEAKDIAYNRLIKGHSLPMPNSFRKDAIEFAERVKRYFKVTDVTIVGYTDGTFIKDKLAHPVDVWEG